MAQGKLEADLRSSMVEIQNRKHLCDSRRAVHTNRNAGAGANALRHPALDRARANSAEATSRNNYDLPTNRRRSTNARRERRAGTAARSSVAALRIQEAPNSARTAGLRYTTDGVPGIRRFRHGSGFRYVQPNGRELKNPAELRRIKSLAVPPAWSEVWISTNAKAHLQATGRDARGRKQYRYHPRWREIRDETKYNRMIAFGKALPAIRRRVRRDIRRAGLGREKVVAAVVRLMELSAARVGNEEYAHQNNSYGLTTLRDRHAKVNGNQIHLEFRGKSGINQVFDIHHPVLSRIVRHCQELPGQDLFQYRDEANVVHDITSGDVNDYLAETTGRDFTAKDFRTWTGTVLAAVALREFEHIDSQARAKKNIVRAIEQVAERLGNTPSVCKKCYVHPAILESYMDGTLASALGSRPAGELHRTLHRLNPEEAAVVALLQRRLKETEGRRLRRQLRQSIKAMSGKRSVRRKALPAGKTSSPLKT